MVPGGLMRDVGDRVPSAGEESHGGGREPQRDAVLDGKWRLAHADVQGLPTPVLGGLGAETPRLCC